MRKWSGHLAVAAMLVASVLAPAAAQAQGKIKVALMDFDNNAERSWWFYDQLGPAARNQIDTAFSENAELSKRFSVVERDKLALVMKEQGLATSGAVDPQSAAKVGRLLGVKVHRHGRRGQGRCEQDRRGRGEVRRSRRERGVGGRDDQHAIHRYHDG